MPKWHGLRGLVQLGAVGADQGLERADLPDDLVTQVIRRRVQSRASEALAVHEPAARAVRAAKPRAFAEGSGAETVVYRATVSESKSVREQSYNARRELPPFEAADLTFPSLMPPNELRSYCLQRNSVHAGFTAYKRRMVRRLAA